MKIKCTSSKVNQHQYPSVLMQTGRRLGLGDHKYPDKVLKDGPEPGSRLRSLDEMVLDADGFVGVFPEDKYKIVER